MVYLQGCAANPSSAPSADAARQPAVATAQSPDPVAAPVAKAKAKDDARTATTKRYAREMGYRIETQNGEPLYCRNFTPIGQRIEQKECLTPQVLEDTARFAEQNKASWQQPHGCTGSCDK
jgi:pyruvate/2-oxoglutarate dehydrogenase complex dihydrolipoamide acyltransferase (E2) component